MPDDSAPSPNPHKTALTAWQLAKYARNGGHLDDYEVKKVRKWLVAERKFRERKHQEAIDKFAPHVLDIVKQRMHGVPGNEIAASIGVTCDKLNYWEYTFPEVFADALKQELTRLQNERMIYQAVALHEVQTLVTEEAPEAVKTLKYLRQKAGKDDRVRLGACERLLDEFHTFTGSAVSTQAYSTSRRDVIKAEVERDALPANAEVIPEAELAGDLTQQELEEATSATEDEGTGEGSQGDGRVQEGNAEVVEWQEGDEPEAGYRDRDERSGVVEEEVSQEA